MEKKVLKQEIDRLWKLSKKDLDKILKNTTRLVKKGEIYLKKISKKGEKNLEAMALALQKEKLYYELGKSLANLSKDKWTKNKKVKKILIKIKEISQKIKKLKH